MDLVLRAAEQLYSWWPAGGMAHGFSVAQLLKHVLFRLICPCWNDGKAGCRVNAWYYPADLVRLENTNNIDRCADWGKEVEAEVLAG